MDDLLAELHRSLSARLRPEDVALLVRRVLDGRLSAAEVSILEPSRRRYSSYNFFSLMADRWEQSSDASSTLEYVKRVFGDEAEVPVSDVAALVAFRDRLGERVGWQPEKTQRWGLERIHAEGWSVRRYHRAWHALDVLNDKIATVDKTQLRRFCALSARAGLGTALTLEEVRADPDAACFVAYYTARRNVRRGFTLDGRDNPFDEIAAMLLARLGDASDWWMVARAYPRPEVLSRLSADRQGELIGTWWKTMRVAASLCAEIDRHSPVNRDTMIVERGQDSDTWNLAAGAYNVARAAWLSALAATDSLDILTVTCPPKLPRLMAGDLIFWHTATGGDVAHPDVRVAAWLAPAWRVLAGEASCTYAEVHEACAAEKVDAETSGWTAPLAKGALGTSSPTPELVHGISVGDPILAAVLRKAGAWSGGPIRWDVLAPVLPVL